MNCFRHHEAISKFLRSLRAFSLRFSSITAFEVLQKMCALAECAFHAEKLFVGLNVIY